jgi:phosphate transport system permease protein
LLAGRGTSRRGDAVFAAGVRGASLFVVALVTLTGAFLLWKAVPSLLDNQANFLTSRVWQPATTPPKFGIAALLWTTVLASLVALLLAVPVAIGVALFITQYAPRRLAKPVGYLIDLLAAIPSIIYGLWGIRVLGPVIAGEDSGVRSFLEKALGWFPLFSPTSVSQGTVFLAAIVLAIMILPIVTAISREVFDQTPLPNKEAALALGATRWEMIRTAVLPFGRPGVISASMLGLGRALGETIAVTIILSQPSSLDKFDLSVFFGGETFASKIANNASEFSTPQKTGAYIAAGLVLFVITFAVNAVARWTISRTARED